ncbi:hypothetical protein HDU96_008013 [Phlyctochytrium bullatum]|nr:hypothetical protein HDU96_008013 [Phlyctochytrium bullatum]
MAPTKRKTASSETTVPAKRGRRRKAAVDSGPATAETYSQQASTSARAGYASDGELDESLPDGIILKTATSGAESDLSAGGTVGTEQATGTVGGSASSSAVDKVPVLKALSINEDWQKDFDELMAKMPTVSMRPVPRPTSPHALFTPSLPEHSSTVVLSDTPAVEVAPSEASTEVVESDSNMDVAEDAVPRPNPPTVSLLSPTNDLPVTISTSAAASSSIAALPTSSALDTAAQTRQPVTATSSVATNLGLDHARTILSMPPQAPQALQDEELVMVSLPTVIESLSPVAIEDAEAGSSTARLLSPAPVHGLDIDSIGTHLQGSASAPLPRAPPASDDDVICIDSDDDVPLRTAARATPIPDVARGTASPTPTSPVSLSRHARRLERLRKRAAAAAAGTGGAVGAGSRGLHLPDSPLRVEDLDTPAAGPSNSKPMIDLTGDEDVVIGEIKPIGPPPQAILPSQLSGPIHGSDLQAVWVHGGIVTIIPNTPHRPYTHTLPSIGRPLSGSPHALPRNSLFPQPRRPAHIPPPDPEPADPARIKCAICLCTPDAKTPLSTTICGHIFCEGCLRTSIKTVGKKCPTCRKSIAGKNSVIRLFL